MCDVTNKNQIFKAIQSYKPDILIHCAAYTAVDKAENDVEICRQINVLGTQNIVFQCKKNDIPVVFISSDYVFDGKSNKPYSVDDERNALNQYGQSKIDAENIVMKYQKHYIIRTSWLFGDGINFVKTISSIALKNKEVVIVDDQVGSPTYTEDLALAIIKIIKKHKYGLYHVTNEGYCSWADLAQEAFLLQSIKCNIIRVTSDEYNSKARRPLNSRLSKKSLDHIDVDRLPNWRDSLAIYINKFLKG